VAEGRGVFCLAATHTPNVLINPLIARKALDLAPTMLLS
jgi:hypothetical protein